MTKTFIFNNTADTVEHLPPDTGYFTTDNVNAWVDYEFCENDTAIELDITHQRFEIDDVNELINFLTAAREKLKSNRP